ncbi:pyridoxamine 5'-phosphate oxidase family protein [Kribbella sp. NPDC000426]|uniref:pyridoxamine 5'-phosphate oxidase family protein n=1 Tax=Kribbella sp. NPDC000426 TaxID=3154255 RepID=UPI00331AB71B
MRWEQVVAEQPRLGELGTVRLLEPGVVLVATVRRDGTPRVSPVEPLVVDGELWLCMMQGSAKAADLVRDPRVLVHNIVTSRDGADGEFKVRGVVRTVDDLDVQQRFADEADRRLGWRPVPGRFHLFAVDVESVTVIRYDTASGDQYVAIWPPAREFVRRGTSATSVGEPEKTHELLD